MSQRVAKGSIMEAEDVCDWKRIPKHDENCFDNMCVFIVCLLCIVDLELVNGPRDVRNREDCKLL